jgi:hypothetical protein
MCAPYILGIWQSSLIDACNFVNQHAMADQVIELLPDSAMKHGYWIMLRLTGDQLQAWKESQNSFTPKLSFVP